jgi:hypothetical protein
MWNSSVRSPVVLNAENNKKEFAMEHQKALPIETHDSGSICIDNALVPMEKETVESVVERTDEAYIRALQDSATIQNAMADISKVIIQGVVYRFQERISMESYVGRLVDAATSILVTLDMNKVHGLLRRVIIGLFDKLCE